MGFVDDSCNWRRGTRRVVKYVWRPRSGDKNRVSAWGQLLPTQPFPWFLSLPIPDTHRGRKNEFSIHAYTKHWRTYWCPCNSNVRPLRPPMSHMMTLWSEAPENSSLWMGSHHRVPILPGGDRGVNREKKKHTVLLCAAKACWGTVLWSDLLAPSGACWENCRKLRPNTLNWSKLQLEDPLFLMSPVFSIVVLYTDFIICFSTGLFDALFPGECGSPLGYNTISSKYVINIADILNTWSGKSKKISDSSAHRKKTS